MSNDETNFPHKSLSTITQVLRICIAFANGSSANIIFSKIQLSMMVDSEEFLYDVLSTIPEVIFCTGV